MAATPILDLQIEPPKQRSQWPSLLLGAVLGGIVSYFLIINDVSLRWLPSFLFAVLVHELAHLAGGMMAGMAPGAISVGPFTLSRSGARWSLRVEFRNPWLGGFSKPLPAKGQFDRGAYALMVAAGPLSNILLAAIAWQRWPSLFWTNVICIVLSLAPFSVSDGARLLMLRDRRRAHSWMALLQLQSEETAGVRPRDWDADLFKAVVEMPPAAPEYAYCHLLAYYRYLDFDDHEAALESIEKALAGCKRTTPVIRACCYLEAAGANSLLRQNAAAARRWLELSRRAHNLPSVAGAEGQIAFCEQRYADAARLFDEAREWLLKRKLDSGLARFAVDKFAEYRERCEAAAPAKSETA